MSRISETSRDTRRGCGLFRDALGYSCLWQGRERNRNVEEAFPSDWVLMPLSLRQIVKY
jgi:hypothetical protein